MTNAEKMDYATKVFVSFLTEKQSRLNRGQMLRAQMHAVIERHEQPKGYRPDWIRDMAMRLVKVLQDGAVEFNKAHPDDMCSGEDLKDVLHTTLGLFSR